MSMTNEQRIAITDKASAPLADAMVWGRDQGFYDDRTAVAMGLGVDLMLEAAAKRDINTEGVEKEFNVTPDEAAVIGLYIIAGSNVLAAATADGRLTRDNARKVMSKADELTRAAFSEGGHA